MNWEASGWKRAIWVCLLLVLLGTGSFFLLRWEQRAPVDQLAVEEFAEFVDHAPPKVRANLLDEVTEAKRDPLNAAERELAGQLAAVEARLAPHFSTGKRWRRLRRMIALVALDAENDPLSTEDIDHLLTDLSRMARPAIEEIAAVLKKIPLHAGDRMALLKTARLLDDDQTKPLLAELFRDEILRPLPVGGEEDRSAKSRLLYLMTVYFELEPDPHKRLEWLEKGQSRQTDPAVIELLKINRDRLQTGR